MKYPEVAIVGKGEGWQDAPDEGEVWGVNEIVLSKRSVNRIFAMHKTEVSNANPLLIATKEYSIANQIPIVTLETSLSVPTNEVYPINEIVAYFKTQYFANSICYMIAYALYYEVEKLDLYGVNHQQEWKHRACVEYWLGRAVGLGVALQIHGPSKLLRTKDGVLYGYGETFN